MKQVVPPMTSDKAVWSAIATAAVTVVMMMAGLIPIDEQAFSDDLTRALTLFAALVVQAAVAGATTYFKRNYLK